MLFRYTAICGVLSVVTLCANASPEQRGVDTSLIGNVHVRVVYQSDRPARSHLRVLLLNGSGSTPVSEAFTNDEGRAEFRQIPVGMYHVVVTGEGIEDADSGMFEVDRRKTSQDLFISVHSSETNSTSTVGGAASIATVNLKIPAEAKREFDNASKAIAGQDWPKALQKLNRAIVLYPSYAAAYNNLGVVYGHTNEPKREREALENAVSLDDHFVAAKVNLAKLCLREHDSVEAEKLLENSLRVQPNSVETMTLLAEAQLLNGHFDAAIATAHNVHALPHQNFAVIHYIAARSLEHENRPKDALEELQIFLTEEPTGARADHVREEIAKLKNSLP